MLFYSSQVSRNFLHNAIRNSVLPFVFLAFFCVSSMTQGFSDGVKEKPNELVKRAWEAHKTKKHEESIVFADRCIKLYGEDAQRQQSKLNGFPTSENVNRFFLLNTVGQCLNVKAKSCLALGKKKEAKEALELLIESYSFAQGGGKTNRKPLINDAKRRLKDMNKE